MSRNNSINLPIINNSSNSAPFARSNSLNITHSNESVRSSRAESPASSQHGSLHKINELKLENERLKKNLAHAEEAIMSYQSYLKGGNSSRFVNGLNRKEVIPLQIESEVFDQENQTTTSIPSSVNISNNANMKKSFISTQTSGKYQECNFLCNKIEKLEKSLTEKSNELSTMEIELRKIISIKDNEINDLRHQNNQLRNHSNINLKNDSIWKTHLINIQQLLYQEKINIRHEKDMIKQQLKSFQSSFYMIQQQYQIKSNVSNELNCEFKELQNEIIQLKNEKKSLCDFHTLHYDQLIKNNKDLQSQIILLEEQRKQYELDKIEYQNDIQRLQHEISSFNNHHHHIHEPKNPWNFSTENFTAENFSEVIEEIVDNLNKLQLSFKNELKSVEGLAHVKDLTRISSIQELTLEKDKLVCDFDHQRELLNLIAFSLGTAEQRLAETNPEIATNLQKTRRERIAILENEYNEKKKEFHVKPIPNASMNMTDLKSFEESSKHKYNDAKEKRRELYNGLKQKFKTLLMMSKNNHSKSSS